LWKGEGIYEKVSDVPHLFQEACKRRPDSGCDQIQLVREKIMSLSDPVADMLTKIRNANSARFEKVDISTSRMKLEITKILKNEGYIKTFKKINQNGKNYIRIFLKYTDKNTPVINNLQRLSKPGRRVFVGYKKMPRIYNGYGTVIISTSEGIITGKKAVEKKVGGELICSVW
jgi:small subunit ribosomal protein S8